jgi:hypothetical protein
MGGEDDLMMQRRRNVELKRQLGIRKKKQILFGRDIDGSEGGKEFNVPQKAHLSDFAKVQVGVGVRAQGEVSKMLSYGLEEAYPAALEKERNRLRMQSKNKREGTERDVLRVLRRSGF